MKSKFSHFAGLMLSASLFCASNAHAFLVNYWPMDETEGLVATPVVGSASAEFKASQAALVWTAGTIGNAAQMSGATSGYFRVDLNSVIANGTTSMTIAMWINPTSRNQSYEGLFMTRASHPGGVDKGPTGSAVGNGNLGIAWRTLPTEPGDFIDSRWSGAVISNPAGIVSADDGVGTNGGWYHVAVVWDGVNGTQTQYINGVQSAIGDGNVGQLDTGGIWHMGNDSCCGGREFNGFIDDVAVWDEAVTPADMAELFAKTKSPLDINPPTDNDGDGLPNDYEDMFPGFLDKDVADADQDIDRVGGELAGALTPDGLTNGEERAAGTDPTNPDSDDDGLLDGAELNVHFTSPLNPDSDGDTIPDGEEVAADGGADGFVTDPNKRDTDGDTIDDNVEITNGTSPIDPNDPPPPPVPTEGLVALYTFDETSGTTAADSAFEDGAQDAEQLEGAVTFLPDGGLIGGALDLDGSTVLTVADALPAGTTEFTMSVWLNDDGTRAGYRGIYSTRDLTGESNLNWGINIEGDSSTTRRGDLRFANTGASSFGVDTPDTILAGQWHHLAMTYTTNSVDTTVCKAYLDGALITTPTAARVDYVTSGNYQIGTDFGSGGRRFDGKLDDLSVWNVALTDAQIMAITRAGRVGIGISPPEGIDFRITSIVRNPDGSLDITWNSDPTDGVQYRILHNPDFATALSGWADFEDGWPTGGESTTYNIPAANLPAGERLFIRVEVAPQ